MKVKPEEFFSLKFWFIWAYCEYKYFRFDKIFKFRRRSSRSRFLAFQSALPSPRSQSDVPEQTRLQNPSKKPPKATSLPLMPLSKSSLYLHAEVRLCRRLHEMEERFVLRFDRAYPQVHWTQIHYLSKKLHRPRPKWVHPNFRRFKARSRNGCVDEGCEVLKTVPINFWGVYRSWVQPSLVQADPKSCWHWCRREKGLSELQGGFDLQAKEVHTDE